MIAERFKEVDWHPDRAERRKFGLLLTAGFPVMATSLFLIVRWASGEWRPVIFYGVAGGGAALGLTLAAFPGIARPVYVVWHALICVVDFFVTNILLSAFFFIILTPAGLVLRLLGRSSIGKSFDHKPGSYWRKSEKVEDPRRYYRQF
jgi:hypothetical protein